MQRNLDGSILEQATGDGWQELVVVEGVKEGMPPGDANRKA